MVVALLTVEILVPGSASLKEKRGVVKRIKDRSRNKFNISVAEVDFQDKWQRAKLAFALVGSDHKNAETTMQKLFQMLDSDYGFEIVNFNFEFL
ncbi:DUF503 domain-containing protein [Caldithrix abyssi]|uniref:YlxP-like protein n=1 Tax=Caldithrix abyssi DSM 13497 TaxID=880073 RepID=H1XXM8_CALAY|nr:DUF503 domain-containing protein [Caldithrix abyssi]APF19241.1 hypothetical protein Cabys_2492 [Caldithrix abyssi DSM 13497]EHO43152.1 protein of unknown function DUF503 [Caldithrix abyssi DSM 13497]